MDKNEASRFEFEFPNFKPRDASGNFDRFVRLTPIAKGWSDNKKYLAETPAGKKYFLRVSDVGEYARKKLEYEMLRAAHDNGVLTPDPVEFGICGGGLEAYSITGWIEGRDAEEAVIKMRASEQFIVGDKAGETLRKIHSIKAPADAEPWGEWFYKKVSARIDFYHKNGLRSEEGDVIAAYLRNNRRFIDGRPRTFNHGDYHISNLMLDKNGDVVAVDFNGYNLGHGDPWWEFDNISWGDEPPGPYHTGLIRGYFGGEPPDAFFETLSYYLAYDALAALCDTSVGIQGEPETGRRHLKNVLRWYGGMGRSVPEWYAR
ncbi:MAG: phosphotransferase [Defluviitaleaceae bacterium]|nr:phosphotransferase [Defluviitaleaceae bacterium]